ncbi:11946_t:CDS:2, partial [Rhizophagus irregularis]
EWVKEIMWYLDIAYLKTLDSEFSKESMLVSGIGELVEIFDEMLEDEMAIYERFSDIIKNFSENKKLAYALLDL